MSNQEYQEKTQIEHVLDLPDTYIGSTITQHGKGVYLVNDKTGGIEYRCIDFNAGINRIFEEILLNAYDQSVREGTGLSWIKVSITNDMITVTNNGKGIPIQMNDKGDAYIPEMVFGRLMTSSNYNKDEIKYTSGKNGFGSKLTNIYSSSFTIDILSPPSSFTMTWKDNMSHHTKPIIKKVNRKASSSHTMVSFIPDFKRFGMKELSNDMIAYMKRRVYDIAFMVSSKVSVYFNDVKVPVTTFKSYIDLLHGHEYLSHISDGGWNVAVFMKPDKYDGPDSLSFVNGIYTNEGGTHINHIRNKLINAIQKKAIGKGKKTSSMSSLSSSSIPIFLIVSNVSIPNPSFGSQTKESLSSPVPPFNPSMTSSFMKKLLVGTSSLMTYIKGMMKIKENYLLSKTESKKGNTGGKRLLGIPKLEEANWAGGSKSHETRLILTEGDSAKTFAMSGIDIIGRDKYGIFPLKGKLINVRNQSITKIAKNEEIQNLKKILGLKQNMDYESIEERKGLRYGGIIILTDSDVDGSHIKGLIINLFHMYWPSLLKSGYLTTLNTPIMKVTLRDDSILSFYNLNEYHEWKERNKDKKVLKIKYYKGLGTSLNDEAKDAMTGINNGKLITYKHMDQHDDDNIILAFDKIKTSERKKWLEAYDKNVCLPASMEVSTSDFINKELIHFSIYDTIRSIPSLIDGLKVTQRKILYTGLKHFKNKGKGYEMKVAQFGALVAQMTDYHHGEESINNTLVGMAQTYIGSNNYNLFQPIGQFGTREDNGRKSKASSRYIFTNINPLINLIYRQEDECLLNYIDSDGMLVEPCVYYPIIPMVLVNRSSGIGTGYSSNIPSHSIHDIINYLMTKLKGEERNMGIRIWFNKYKCNNLIKKDGDSKYITYGCMKRVKGKKKGYTITITELPIDTWTKSYKIFIEKELIEKEGLVKTYTNQSTEHDIHITLHISPKFIDKVDAMDDDELMKTLGLISSISTSNMWLFDHDDKLRKYETAMDIIDDYYDIRLKMYGKRKDIMIKELEESIQYQTSKIKFMTIIKNMDIVKECQDEEALTKKLHETHGIPIEYIPKFINIPLKSLVNNNMKSLIKKLHGDEDLLKCIMNKSIQDMWYDELIELEKGLK